MKFRLLAALAVLSCPLHAAVPAPVLDVPAIDVAKALSEDLARDKLEPGPARYAIGANVTKVRITPDASEGGRWDTLKDGRLAWTLEVHADQARSIDLGFSRLRLPSGAELRLVEVATGEVLGPFTDADNPKQGAFWTPIAQGDRVRIELTLPADKRAFLWLELATVNRGYQDPRSALQKSGSCNVDVVCPAGDAWRDEIRSAALITYGGFA